MTVIPLAFYFVNITFTIWNFIVSYNRCAVKIF